MLGLPLAFTMPGDWITRTLIVVSFLGFGGALLINFAQLENDSLSPTNVTGIGAGLDFATVIALIRVYVKWLTAKDSPSIISIFSILKITTLARLKTLPFGWTTLSNTYFLYLIFHIVLGD